MSLLIKSKLNLARVPTRDFAKHANLSPHKKKAGEMQYIQEAYAPCKQSSVVSYSVFRDYVKPKGFPHKPVLPKRVFLRLGTETNTTLEKPRKCSGPPSRKIQAEGKSTRW